MGAKPNRFELIGYLEEALPAEDMARIEECLRTDESMREALRELVDEIGTEEHSLATIWRRHRLTCPSRERLGAMVAGGLVPDEAEYIRFHLDVIKCRWCLANLRDLESHAANPGKGDASPRTDSRRSRRFFETSVGHLPKKDR